MCKYQRKSLNPGHHINFAETLVSRKTTVLSRLFSLDVAAYYQEELTFLPWFS